jgi:hypothetical protein
MEMFRNIHLEIKFEALSLPEFWICMKGEHQELSQLAANLLMHSGAAYLRENHFQQ